MSLLGWSPGDTQPLEADPVSRQTRLEKNMEQATGSDITPVNRQTLLKTLPPLAVGEYETK